MPLRRIAPPPSDEQLAAAEQTEMIRRRDQLAALEDGREQERLAAAGEPNAQDALRASASVLTSRPVGQKEDGDDESRVSAETPADRTRVAGDKRETKRAPKRPNHIPTPLEEKEPDEDAAARAEKNAYSLMDIAYKKWEKGARKDLGKANRELAFDLGKDTALYLRSGIIRMADIHATIEKLTASAKAGKDNSAEDEDYDDQLEDLRKKMRDE